VASFDNLGVLVHMISDTPSFRHCEADFSQPKQSRPELLKTEIAAHLSGARNDKRSLMNQATTKICSRLGGS